MSSQQSWADWFWGYYASVAPSSTTESVGDASSSKQPPQTQPLTPSSSPYGPYVRTGRGGAGNFTWQSEQPSNSAEYLEAQNPSSLSERRKAAIDAEHLDMDEAVKTKATQKPISKYVRVGRGYVQMDETQQPSTLGSGTVQSPISSIVHRQAVAHPGRGGAGNLAAAAEMNEKAEREKKNEDHTEAEKRRNKIEEEIETALPAPPDAWLGGRRRSVDPTEQSS